MQVREYKDWLKVAKREGWRVRQSDNGVVLYPPAGRPIPLHGNHSSRKLTPRTIRNQRAELQRAGLPI